MTDKEKAMIKRINDFAQSALGDIEDPQKVPVSMQLDKLKPIFETIAKEEGISLEDMFIKYMDLQSELSVLTQNKLQESLQDINQGGDMPLLFR